MEVEMEMESDPPAAAENLEPETPTQFEVNQFQFAGFQPARRRRVLRD
jgi:hypothetical protein